MEQEYPGDIRPLMRACAELAQRRRESLARVRRHVDTLKGELDRTLERFAEEREHSRENVRRLLAELKRRLAENQRRRSEELARLRESFREAAEARRSTLRATLTDARNAVRASVNELRQRTAHAKSMRFRTGSFNQLHGASHRSSASGLDAGSRPRRRAAVRTNEVADFLDALGPDGELNRG